MMKILVAPTCTDKIRNNGEIGIDCGGPCSLKCDNQTCNNDADCKSGICGDNGRCAGL